MRAIDRRGRQYSGANAKARDNDEVSAELIEHLTGSRPDDAPSVEAEVSASDRDPFDAMLSRLANLVELKPGCRVCAFAPKGAPHAFIAYAVKAGIYGEGLCGDRAYAESTVAEAVSSAVRSAVAQADYAVGATVAVSRYGAGKVVGVVETESGPGVDIPALLKSVKGRLSHLHGGCFRVMRSHSRTGRLLVEDAYMLPRGRFAGEVYV